MMKKLRNWKKKLPKTMVYGRTSSLWMSLFTIGHAKKISETVPAVGKKFPNAPFLLFLEGFDNFMVPKAR